MNKSTEIDRELSIEAVDDHVYLVEARLDGDDVTVKVIVDRAFVDRLEVPGACDVEVVSETMTFLLGHQRLDDLPPLLELDDIAAAYPEFEEWLRGALS